MGIKIPIKNILKNRRFLHLFYHPPSRPSQIIPLPDSIHIHLLHRDTVLHASHGGYEAGCFLQAFEVAVAVGARDILIATQARKTHHSLYISLGIVFGRGCPAGNDGTHIVRHVFAAETQVVRIEQLPYGAIAILHRFKLYKRRIGLCSGCSLPLVIRVADVERIVVTDSSCHVFKGIF